MSLKIRLDKLLVDQGLAASRERAQALILAGRVLVAEQRVDKPGTPVTSDAVLRLLGDDLRYVGRGGLKLERALSHWSIDPSGVACLDVGASTGGFTDCLLQHGAASVLAIDTGYGQIAEKLRSDPRVTLRERCNARLLAPGDLRSASPTPIAIMAIDVSFISVTLVLPAVLAALAPPAEPAPTAEPAPPAKPPQPESQSTELWTGQVVILVKPQFEAGREHVGKGGIVRDQAARQFAIDRVHDSVLAHGGSHTDIIDSPIRGMEGNHEYLLYARFGQPVE